MSWSPAGSSECTEQSSHAAAPLTKTAPSSLGSHGTSTNRSRSFAASERHSSSWPSASTLTPSRGNCRNRGHVVELCATQTDTSGGVIETEVNELAAIPTGSSSSSAQTAVTPLGKQL